MCCLGEDPSPRQVGAQDEGRDSFAPRSLPARADNSDAPSYGPSSQATYSLDASYPLSNPAAFAWARRSKERTLASSSLRFKGEIK